MTQLLRAQADFVACLLDESTPLPPGWDARRAAGIAVYRNAYRARLIDVLRVTFERTARLVGEDAFVQAAAHHLITNPPASWTVDLAGEGFWEVCTDLFADDADVGEVAWLEWTMHRAFTATDAVPMTLADFASATAGFDTGQWDGLGFELIPGTALRAVSFDLVKLWATLADPLNEVEVARLAEPKWVLLWREGEMPVFGLVPLAEGLALTEILTGGSFGDVCTILSNNVEASQVPAAAGGMLRNWIEIGLIIGLRPALQPTNQANRSNDTE